MDLTDKEHTLEWKSIGWIKAEEVVNNLQFRIASAAKNRNWKKVSKLSRLLTRSFYAKLLAVRRVTSDKGIKLLVLMESFGERLQIKCGLLCN